MVQRAFHFEDVAEVNWMPLYDEAVEDLECAFFLSANCFYKQALQVLRGVIELSVAHGYFILSQDAFEQWRDDPNYRLPYVRGNGGMLHRLHQAQWIDDRIYETGYELYGLLNGCVHATPGRMGSRRGEMDREKLEQFCSLSSRVGGFVIDLTMHFLLGSESLYTGSPGPLDSTDDIPF
ncbi:MAG: hypothetical protein U9R72_03445 [Chloroflexota bacterium]|nr:hypothetical protein [Chloroflexota bacterium]